MTGGISGRARRARFLGAALVLAGCISQAQSAQIPERPSFAPTRAPAVNVAAQRILEARIRELGRNFDGEVGIAVREVDSDWTTSWNGERYFPQQSVSKFWVALTAFARADAGRLDLSQEVTVRRQDLTLFNQPIAAADRAERLYDHARQSDLPRAHPERQHLQRHRPAPRRRAGRGPRAARAPPDRRHSLRPGRAAMQSQIAGLQWSPAFSVGNAFSQARSGVPLARRREAFESYIDDPIDGATPEGLVAGLARLQRGELLSPAARPSGCSRSCRRPGPGGSA